MEKKDPREENMGTNVKDEHLTEQCSERDLTGWE